MDSLPFMPLLRTLQPLSITIDSIISAIPAVAHKPRELQCQKDEVIAVWTRESKHNYEDNTSINEVGVLATPTPAWLNLNVCNCILGLCVSNCYQVYRRV